MRELYHIFVKTTRLLINPIFYNSLTFVKKTRGRVANGVEVGAGLTAATGFEIDWANNLYHDERVG